MGEKKKVPPCFIFKTEDLTLQCDDQHNLISFKIPVGLAQYTARYYKGSIVPGSEPPFKGTTAQIYHFLA